MTYLEFKKKWIGKSIDWDGYYGGQCFDVYRQYCSDLGLGQSPKVTGAKDIWTSYLTEDFDKIENTPDGIPKQGDVIIWGTIVGQYGHVAIFDNGDVNSFTSIDQNWPVDNGTGVLHEVKHTYNGVLGWLRPKVNDIIQEDMTDDQKNILQFLTEQGANESKVREAFGALNDISGLKQTIENQNKEIDDLKTSQKDLTERIEQLEADAKANNELIESYQSTISTAKETESNLQAEIQTWKNRYENKCKETVDKYSTLELFKFAIKSLFNK